VAAAAAAAASGPGDRMPSKRSKRTDSKLTKMAPSSQRAVRTNSSRRGFVRDR